VAGHAVVVVAVVVRVVRVVLLPWVAAGPV
jgi:hypothetical protein